ncbi:putative DNA primase subunit [Dickeya phage phiDP23.1]|nr:putative DNA primase subunit [Dickeya phage phiD3]AIM51812.1 putative DNA primase subunit [Dickeya phage phiDP23.1]ATW62079.1 putative DNA primase subunit [Dickeya phage PP35]
MNGWAFEFWLKKFDERLSSEYNMEKFRLLGDTSGRPLPSLKPLPKLTQTARIGSVAAKRDESLFGNMLRLDLLPPDHKARQYVQWRGLPESTWSLLYYTQSFREDLKLFETDPEKQLKIPDDERLVIPFWTQDGRMKIVQGRAFDKKATLRYATVKPKDEDTKVYGEDRVMFNKTKLVVEGPIDSLFLPNCLASADSDLLSVKGDIYIPDNQYRNPQVCDGIQKMIDKGVKVVLFPPDVPWKDINDMVMPSKGNMLIQDLLKLIAKNVYQGMAASLQFAELRKVK